MAGTQPRFYLRGMGNIDFDNNASQPVSMVFDEIALENNVLRSLPLFDIERVEVLKGPQSSIFRTQYECRHHQDRLGQAVR